jgi:hypothetical protein
MLLLRQVSIVLIFFVWVVPAILPVKLGMSISLSLRDSQAVKATLGSRSPLTLLTDVDTGEIPKDMSIAMLPST